LKPHPALERRRFVKVVGLVLLAVAMGVGLLAITRGFTRPAQGPQPNRLADALSKTIETRGIDAAVAQYRTLREQGFPGLRESESDTNSLGYRLLGKDDTQSAIRVFQLNVETHPRSANVHDSLGEAYVAAGNKALAIESYQRAVAINPKMKSAASELQRLANIKRKPYPLIVLLHIGAGALGILSGAVALSLRKGSRRHAMAGRVFVVSMLGTSASGAYRAFVAPDGEPVNVLMGLLTFYLVATAWLTVRRRKGGTGLFDWAALLVVVAVATGLIRLGMTDGRFAVVAFFFGAVALLAAGLDLRMILRGGVFGAARIVRHLWRMGTALYIAVASFFLGQPQVFPYAVRRSGLLFVPVVLVVIALIFWLIRVLFTNAYQRAAPPKTSLVVGQAAT
jgi:uncharacterized membrane protein